MEKNFKLKKYQKEIVKLACEKLDTTKKVGLDVFTRGGKSFIAMDLISYLIETKACRRVAILAPASICTNLKNNIFKNYIYRDSLVFVSNTKLSVGHNLQNAIREELKIKDKNEDICIDALLIDEAHRTFGTNIRYQIEREKERKRKREREKEKERKSL